MRFLWFIWMQDRPDLLFIEASLLHIRFTSNLTNINFLLRNKSFVQKGFQNWISTVSLRYQILLDTLIRFLITEFLLLPSVHQFHGQIQVCTENPPGVRIFTCHTKHQLWCPPLSSTDTPAGPHTQTARRQIHCQWRVQHSVTPGGKMWLYGPLLGYDTLSWGVCHPVFLLGYDTLS